jgi:hypothetical protein
MDFWTVHIVRNSGQVEYTAFRPLNLFLPSGEWRETSALLGPLVRGNLSHMGCLVVEVSSYWGAQKSGRLLQLSCRQKLVSFPEC